MYNNKKTNQVLKRNITLDREKNFMKGRKPCDIGINYSGTLPMMIFMTHIIS